MHLDTRVEGTLNVALRNHKEALVKCHETNPQFKHPLD